MNFSCSFLLEEAALAGILKDFPTGEGLKFLSSWDVHNSECYLYSYNASVSSLRGKYSHGLGFVYIQIWPSTPWKNSSYIAIATIQDNLLTCHFLGRRSNIQ